MVYKQTTFLDQHFMIRAISPSLRYVVEGFFCTLWISLEPYIIDLSRFYKTIHKLEKIYKKPIRIMPGNVIKMTIDK